MADSKISALTDGTTPATTDASPWARSGGTTVKLTWAELKAAMPGAEIGYDQVSSGTVTVSSSSSASPTTVIACAAHTFDGGPVLLQFFAIGVRPVSGSDMNFTVKEGATDLGVIAFVGCSVSAQTVDVPVSGWLRFTPSAGSHTYTIGAYNVSGSTGSVFSGAGGSAGVANPAFARFTKV